MELVNYNLRPFDVILLNGTKYQIVNTCSHSVQYLLVSDDIEPGCHLVTISYDGLMEKGAQIYRAFVPRSMQECRADVGEESLRRCTK